MIMIPHDHTINPGALHFGPDFSISKTYDRRIDANAAVAACTFISVFLDLSGINFKEDIAL
jgi:hypothetical protein